MEEIGKRVCPVCGALVHASDPCPVCLLHSASRPDAFVFPSATATCSSEPDFGHCQILRNTDGTPIELGRGAMGVTYKALDTHLDFVVALKVINIEMLGDECACRRFVREARAAARVRHENVASIFHLGKQGRFYFYTMEFVEGEPLNRVIRRAGPLRPTAALSVIRLVAAGLEAMANQQLVHRDIKPSNIMVNSEGNRIVQAKIIDLGLAKSAVEDDAMSAISNPGSFAGTPAYASPEQFAGFGVDIRSDLYSLGITLWEMLCGELPFRGSPLELKDQHRHAPLPVEKLDQIPRPVIEMLRILLEKDPSRRFQRPAELLRAVVKTLEPEQWQVTTDGFGSKKPAARPREMSPNTKHIVSGLKIRAIDWLLGPAIGVLGLVSAWHLSPRHVRALFVSPEKARAAYTIAVLPFENISPNKEDAYFADGVQDEILHDLVGIAELRVVSRTSVMRYRDSNRFDLREVANTLEVTNFLEGTVRRDGNHVRVTMALVDARNHNLIWVDSYDRDLTNIFTVESEIARQVAAKVNARFTAMRRGRVKGERER
jgi:serine/threonine protein kinase